MKKPILKRLLLGLVQHLLAAAILILLTVIIINSQIRVEPMYGSDTYFYYINPFSGNENFEDSKVFEGMFDKAISDITTLVVIKGQLETNGEFDSNKKIDCTAFVNRKGKVNDCTITASYTLDNLIKWGRYGIETYRWNMDKRMFVTYFGEDILELENFYLDEKNHLQFYGFPELGEEGKEQEAEIVEMYSLDNTAFQDIAKQDIEQDIKKDIEDIKQDTNQENKANQEEYEEMLLQWYEIYSYNNQKQLVDLVFEYLRSHMDKQLTIVTDEEGREQVEIQMLRCRYDTIDGFSTLTAIANNWIEYSILESNVINTIENIEYNYNQYLNRNDIYAENNSNLQYLFRIGKGTGAKIYTNLSSNFNYISDEQVITNYFQNKDRYLIYNLAELSYKGNVGMNDEKMYHFLSTYEYAYPEDTMVWIGLDTNYPIQEDQFALANKAYNKIVPYTSQIFGLIAACLILWISLWLYLSYTAGWAWEEDGEKKIHYLNWFDKCYTEFVILLGIVFLGIGLIGISVYLTITTEYGYLRSRFSISENREKIYLYSYAMLYGFMASMVFCGMWYSLMRRIKGKNLWKNSCLHWIFSKIQKGFSMILYHRNTTIRTLLPYNVFLLINLFGLLFIYRNRYYSGLSVLALFALLFFDAMIGMALFRHDAEMKEIIDGINKIRQGEVDYQLEIDKLHGENREIAEAVNNIGEGIRYAVATSMKDERLRTDLITNVSHDIKTPLTSIINYVDLLKREKIQQQPASEYIEILEAKAHRLKQLTDDLVEISRISSGNFVLDNAKINFTELLKQGIGEFSDKFEEKELIIIFNEAEKPAYIYADSRRMWRVIENLFHNICKYAMSHTRIYIDMKILNQWIEVVIKNISEIQLNISPEELTERFIRGDEARTTEGSGLGLSITQNLVEAQGGIFEIQLDGDLFKAILRFPEYIQDIQKQEDKPNEKEQEEQKLELEESEKK